MRVLTLAVVAAALASAGCLDVRDFEGAWQGAQVGEHPSLRVGFPDQVSAALAIEEASLDHLRARLTVDGVIDDAVVEPIPGAEADILATTTFDTDPARVFFSFVDTTDGGGPALAIVALFAGNRVEVRILRGGDAPLYGVFVFDAS